jgi:hypothetical protein
MVTTLAELSGFWASFDLFVPDLDQRESMLFGKAEDLLDVDLSIPAIKCTGDLRSLTDTTKKISRRQYLIEIVRLLQ